MQTITAIRWVIRILNVLLAGCVVLIPFLAHDSKYALNLADMVEYTCLGVYALGLVLSWPAEKAGIILSLAGVVGFGLWSTIHYGAQERAYVIWLFAIPPLVLVWCRMKEAK